MPREERCYVDYGYPGCPVLVEDVVMPANLIPLNIMEFEVILGTYWLHYNRAKIECYGKSVTSIVLDYQKLFLWVSKVE